VECAWLAWARSLWSRPVSLEPRCLFSGCRHSGYHEQRTSACRAADQPANLEPRCRSASTCYRRCCYCQLTLGKRAFSSRCASHKLEPLSRHYKLLKQAQGHPKVKSTHFPGEVSTYACDLNNTVNTVPK
jgi:hypothetical protein